MKLASTITQDLGQRYYLIDEPDCYVVEESHAGYWPNDWLPVTINGSTNARCKRFAAIDTDGIVRSDLTYERTRIADMPFDGIVVGETVTLWHNHAGILNLIVSGKRGRIVEVEANIERNRSSYTVPLHRPASIHDIELSINVDVSHIVDAFARFGQSIADIGDVVGDFQIPRTSFVETILNRESYPYHTTYTIPIRDEQDAIQRWQDGTLPSDWEVSEVFYGSHVRFHGIGESPLLGEPGNMAIVDSLVYEVEVELKEWSRLINGRRVCVTAGANLEYKQLFFRPNH